MEQPIEADTTVPAAFDDVRDVLLEEPGSVVGDTSTADERQARRSGVDLVVNMGAGASIHQEVTLQLGPPQSGAGAVRVPVAWHARGRERLFPTFDDELLAARDGTQTSLRLSGTYEAPLGAVGKVAAAARQETAGPRPASYPVDVSDGEHSELYIG